MYAYTASETSAHLMLECNKIAAGNDILLKDTVSARACRVCGTISIPGRTSKITILDPQGQKKPRAKSRRTQKPASEREAKVVVSRCLVCRRSVKTPIKSSAKNVVPGKKNHQNRTSAPPLSQPMILQATAPSNATQNLKSSSLDNANSKKRAKARKHIGLQALLNKSKVSGRGSSESGLDLMDFMKTS